jgi:hypothetical protein
MELCKKSRRFYLWTVYRPDRADAEVPTAQEVMGQHSQKIAKNDRKEVTLFKMPKAA